MTALTGYGTDTWCGDTLVTGRLARGVTVVALALYRRFITPRGTLHGLLNDDCTDFVGGDEEGAYGFDVASYVGAVGYDTAINALPQFMKAEAEKDDRVTGVEVAIAREDRSDGTIALVIEVTATLANSDEAFALTLGVSDAGTVLKGIA